MLMQTNLLLLLLLLTKSVIFFNDETKFLCRMI